MTFLVGRHEKESNKKQCLSPKLCDLFSILVHFDVGNVTPADSTNIHFARFTWKR